MKLELHFPNQHIAEVVPTRIFCIGRNYAAHAEELNNPIPEEPVFFMKPVSSLLPAGAGIVTAGHPCPLHYEAELVILIGQAGRPASDNAALAAIAGISLGLDLTLRKLQDKLKQQGLPWERAKAFDGSAPIGTFRAYQPDLALEKINFLCAINDIPRQQGNSRDMILSVPKIIQALAAVWTLLPGDLIYTGTPSGVGELKANDRISVSSPVLGDFHWHVL